MKSTFRIFLRFGGKLHLSGNPGSRGGASRTKEAAEMFVRSCRRTCLYSGVYSRIAVDHRDSDGRGHWEVCDTTAGLTNDFTHLVY